MLLCIESYRVELRAALPGVQLSNKIDEAPEIEHLPSEDGMPSAKEVNLLKSLEVVLVIDELRVISFDRFGM